MRYLADGAVRTMPVFKVDAIDTLAAGDVFHAGIALALAEGRDAVAAMRFGAAAAGLKCTRFGGSMGAPKRDEVEAFLAQAGLTLRYFFCTEGHGAPQGAQAPAKSSGETGRPLDGEVRCSARSAAKPTTKTMA